MINEANFIETMVACKKGKRILMCFLVSIHNSTSQGGKLKEPPSSGQSMLDRNFSSSLRENLFHFFCNFRNRIEKNKKSPS
jgi:hypothetical protein